MRVVSAFDAAWLIICALLLREAVQAKNYPSPKLLEEISDPHGNGPIWDVKTRDGDLIALQVRELETRACYFDAALDVVKCLKFPTCLRISTSAKHAGTNYGPDSVSALTLCNLQENTNDALYYRGKNLTETWLNNVPETKIAEDFLSDIKELHIPRDVLVEAVSRDLRLFWRLHRPKDVQRVTTWTGAQRMTIFVALVIRQLPLPRVKSIIPVVPEEWEGDGRLTQWNNLLAVAGYDAFRAVFHEFGSGFSLGLDTLAICLRNPLLIAYIDFESRQESMMLLAPGDFFKKLTKTNFELSSLDSKLSEARILVSDVVLHGNASDYELLFLRKTYPHARIHKNEELEAASLRSAMQLLVEQHKPCTCSKLVPNSKRCDIVQLAGKSMPLFIAGNMPMEVPIWYNYRTLVETLPNRLNENSENSDSGNEYDEMLVYALKSMYAKSGRVTFLGRTKKLNFHEWGIETDYQTIRRPNVRMISERNSIPKYRIFRPPMRPKRWVLNGCVNTNQLLFLYSENSIVINYYVSMK